jgi:hypothetical protein
LIRVSGYGMGVRNFTVEDGVLQLRGKACDRE